jgi:branched-chain amino acid aminotransferase
MEKTKSIWLDGELVPWDDVKFHFFTHTLHYGLGVFEGIRAYEQHDGSAAIFRLDAHVRRLFDSARACMIQIPFTFSEVLEGCRAVVADSGLKEGYLRPLVWLGEGALGIGSTSNPVRVGIGFFPWGPYLGAEAVAHGIRCCISSLQRMSNAAHLTRAKICGQYVNSILAKRASKLAGYDEAILLDRDGNVAEGTGENVFVVRDGVLATPSTDMPILPGITRDSVLTLARERAAALGITILESGFGREALYLADEVFLTGTAAEITPVREVEGRVVGDGKPGPVTRALIAAFQDVVRGRDPRHAAWLAKV